MKPNVSAPKNALTTLAQVGDTAITEQMFRAEWSRRRRSNSTQTGPSEKERAEILDVLIHQECLWARARAQGFDRTPEMQARIKGIVVGAFRDSLSKPPSADIREEDLQAQYELQKERLTRPAAVRAAVILLAVPRSASIAKREEIKAKAEGIAQAALPTDGAAFAELARRHSDDQATRFRGGELGWLARDSMGRDVALFDALMMLPKPGGLTPVIETSVGFQIARLLEKREAGPRAYLEVREILRHQMQASQRLKAEDEFQQSLRRGLSIEVNRGRLAGLDLTLPCSSPPSLPGGATSVTPP